MRNKNYFWIGILILLFLFTSYFIKITTEKGANYEVKSSILGLLIFHNPFILGIYILIAIILMLKNNKILKK